MESVLIRDITVVSQADGTAQAPGKSGENREMSAVLTETWVAGGAVRRMRTSLLKGSEAVPYAEQSWRHSERAASRLSLKLTRG